MLYLATILNLEPKDIRYIQRKRTVGIFEKFEEAEEVVLKNAGDIYKNGYYSHALIEEIEPGLYPIPIREIWYKVEFKGSLKDAPKDEYIIERIEKPAKLSRIICFGIG